jgi:hypothetical protein
MKHGEPELLPILTPLSSKLKSLFKKSCFSRGDIKYDRLLELLQNLQTDNNEIPWEYGEEIFEELLRRLKQQPDVLTKLKKFIAKVIGDRGDFPSTEPWGGR